MNTRYTNYFCCLFLILLSTFSFEVQAQMVTTPLKNLSDAPGATITDDTLTISPKLIVKDHYVTSQRVTYVTGRLQIQKNRSLTVNAGDTLVISGGLRLKNKATLINNGNIVVKKNLRLGFNENQEDIAFSNNDGASITIGQNMWGPKPRKSSFGGTIAVNEEVRVNFDGNLFPANGKLYYGSENTNRFSDDTPNASEMSISNYFANNTHNQIHENQNVNNRSEDYINAIKNHNKRKRYLPLVGGVPNDEAAGMLVRFLVDVDLQDDDLPVELTYFNVVSKDGEVRTYWETATEINNSHFMLERSTDGRNYKVLYDKIHGAGNSNVSINYEAEDKDPIEGKIYYRLTQVDFDGKQESWVEVIYHGDKVQGEVLNIYPNPAQFQLNVAMHLLEDEKPTFEFINPATGHQVPLPEVSMTNSKASFDISEFNAGTYVMVVKLNGRVSHRSQVVILGTGNRSKEEDKEQKKKEKKQKKK
ncbi:T9SS type A sorting domain-containing protein [Flammeovirga yaeyamensis]|uniref:T9SS type A sorting domain-containing protein n=1 Tax=Flammeovirga yaeyamensis TaxID=367791 RepID=A0AAX1ND70_9BACT|nr:T9SS type A sorting domain-containing protein [Flammeovirga yaeyamensis]MBB3696890.1 hypothetical protein [Flammeovirga yaeyamensis]NMF33554.1 T9SS type A sorting domain-containing protein [Flammeovirga yaeyamensis]QWG05177.1 T9SS type A sorting domain-containing protein [Flammeovirga yaeyamensis]